MSLGWQWVKVKLNVHKNGNNRFDAKAVLILIVFFIEARSYSGWCPPCTTPQLKPYSASAFPISVNFTSMKCSAKNLGGYQPTNLVGSTSTYILSLVLLITSTINSLIRPTNVSPGPLLLVSLTYTWLPIVSSSTRS